MIQNLNKIKVSTNYLNLLKLESFILKCSVKLKNKYIRKLMQATCLWKARSIRWYHNIMRLHFLFTLRETVKSRFQARKIWWIITKKLIQVNAPLSLWIQTRKKIRHTALMKLSKTSYHFIITTKQTRLLQSQGIKLSQGYQLSNLVLDKRVMTLRTN